MSGATLAAESAPLDKTAGGGEAWRTADESAHCRRYKKFVDLQLSCNSRPPIQWRVKSVQVHTPLDEETGAFATAILTNRNAAPSTDGAAKAVLHGADDKSDFSSEWKLQLQFHEKSFLRLQINEINSLYSRFAFQPENDDGVLAVDVKSGFLTAEATIGRHEILFHFKPATVEAATVKLAHEPFSLAVLVNDNERYVVNEQNLLNLEQYRASEPRQKKRTAELQKSLAELQATLLKNPTAQIKYPRLSDAVDLDATDAWQFTHRKFMAEKFEDEEEGDAGGGADNAAAAVGGVAGKQQVERGGWTDSNPRGPAAVGSDVTVRDVARIGGFSEHSVPLDLPDFGSTPYRFFNSDRFAYPLNSPGPLYGSIPMAVCTHQGGDTSAVLWLNPSDTFAWIKRGETQARSAKDVKKPGDPSSSENNKRRRRGPCNASLRFVSETGVVDLIIFLGPSLDAVMAQYHGLTGLPHHPPLWSVGRHQCRWNYNDAADVEFVADECESGKIPTDAFWLDIDYTVGRKYFEWDRSKFRDPARLVQTLASREQRLVAIVDPHVKVEDQWRVYETMKGFAIKAAGGSGKAFQGRCWPGNSIYPDFLDRDARAAFGAFYNQGAFASPCLQVWNDMNEPSVFDSPEQTLPRDTVHLDGREHREVHNCYGLAFSRTAFEAKQQQQQQEGGATKKQRPFVLTRAFMAGVHKYAAVWLGDTLSTWQYLRASVPMLVATALCGQSFVGADIGGFVGEPSEELRVRWAQLGAWMPFCREHANITTRRREPYLFKNRELFAIARKAYWLRAALMPMWGTLTKNWSTTGAPMLRPVWVIDDADEAADAAAGLENAQFYVGETIVVRAVGHSMKQLEALSAAGRADFDGWVDRTWEGCPRIKDERASGRQPTGESGALADTESKKAEREAAQFDDDHSVTHCKEIDNTPVKIQRWLPPADEWYPLTLETLLGNADATLLPVGLGTAETSLVAGIPAFVKAGTLLFFRPAYKLPSMPQLHRHLAVVAFLRGGAAVGEIFLDDGESVSGGIRADWAVHTESNGGVVVSKFIAMLESGPHPSTSVTRVVLHGLMKEVSSAKALVSRGGRQLQEKEGGGNPPGEARTADEQWVDVPVACWQTGPQSWTAVLETLDLLCVEDARLELQHGTS